MEQLTDLPNDVVAQILFRLPAPLHPPLPRRLPALAPPSRWPIVPRRRPLEVLAYTTFQEPDGALHVAVDAVPAAHTGGAGRRLAQYPKFLPDAKGRAPAPPGPQYCLVLASCDDLLLFS